MKQEELITNQTLIGRIFLGFICLAFLAYYLAVDLHRGLELEQQQEEAKLTLVVHSLRTNYLQLNKDIESLLSKPANKRDLETKNAILTALREMEEENSKLQRAYDHYMDDWSIQQYPYKNIAVQERYIKSIAFKTAVDRYVRSMEMILLLNQPTKDQLQLLMEQSWAMQWHFEHYEK